MTFTLRTHIDGLDMATTFATGDALDEALDRAAEAIAGRYGVAPDDIEHRTWFRGPQAIGGRSSWGGDFVEWRTN